VIEASKKLEEAGSLEFVWETADGEEAVEGKEAPVNGACCGVAWPTRCGRTRAVWPSSFKQNQVAVAYR
jgi:hypothetical protein